MDKVMIKYAKLFSLGVELDVDWNYSFFDSNDIDSIT
jgi:hypothetical protein